ncbi:MAG: hypothetical protein HON47_01685 [Candidatus Diapherotrites archaeon]|uniref:Uncharacterized protein n=1 Tax=Candidatus Iainarchaeum sp. TaxID=3101447 RepID=A0A8T5GDQ6_9ARCH|nr:hypothetical protein [Candidatus Diapherotrites archaeon]
MRIANFFKNLFKKDNVVKELTKELKEEIYAEEEETPAQKVEIASIWDYLEFNENTQAAHLASVIRYDEWVSMDEIRRRIWDLFQIDYKNERSLYPYLKTMVDLGLIETSNIGGKRKWRKRDLLIKIKDKKKEVEEIAIPQALSK